MERTERMTRLAMILALLPTLAAAEEPSRIYIPAEMASAEAGTYVEIRESDEPGASAEVEFRNRSINSPVDSRDYSLTWDGVTITVRFHFNAGPGGADGVSIAPPPGYACWPACEMLLLEGYSDTILIFPAMS